LKTLHAQFEEKLQSIPTNTKSQAGRMFQPWQFSISAGAKEFLMLVEEDIAYMTHHRRTRIAKF